MVDVEAFLAFALAQAGDTYIGDIEVNLDDPDPHAFDCSELVQWACHQAGVDPPIPDGSWIQAQHCNKAKRLIPVEDALTTRGALLFKLGGDSPLTATSRPDPAHVAISLGDGRTMEAQGTEADVGIFPHAERRNWTHGALIPGVAYPGRDTEDDEEDEVSILMFLKGPGGEGHPYSVAGVVGKHLSSPEAVALNRFLQNAAAAKHPDRPTILGEPDPLGKEWQDGIALLDGPLRNVP